MKTWEFTLIVSGRDITHFEVFEALFDAGCHDALIGQSNGVQYLDFDREGANLEEAVASAVADVESVPGMAVTRFVNADLVTMTEIAERSNRSRESVRLLIEGKRGPGGFPVSVSNPKRPNRLWRWADVEHWLLANEFESASITEDPIAPLKSAISASIELRASANRLDPEQRERLFSLISLAGPSSASERKRA